MSASLLGFFALSWARLQRARRRWRRETVDGHDLWITRALGPAVLGFFKPQLVVPQWILDGPAATRSMVLVHENEHIGARDPLLLLTGFLVVLLLPWNLLLWWQLRRLRFAVEVDCDARVLRRVADVQTYANVLLAVNQRGAVAPWGAMAIASRVSQLERRVRIMTSHRQASRLLIGAAVGLGVACVAVAVDLNAPTLSDS
jgi:beta-lactamase regulating signal transducer with metallopeptidase domain